MRDVTGRNLASYQLEHDIAMESDRADSQRYDPLTCQCCGHKRHSTADPECICDGLDWYQLPGGHMECVAHRFERMLGKKKRTFFSFFKR